MTGKELSEIRRHMGKTQSAMADLLGVSHKAIQSFEQGWRRIPAHVERQALWLLAHQRMENTKAKTCWTVRKCSLLTRRHCPAWEFQTGRFCWFVNGTVCHGKRQGSWEEKMAMCRRCDAFRAVMPDFCRDPAASDQPLPNHGEES